MRKTTMAAATAAILLAGCAKPGPAPKPQPGSWSMKTELLDAQGPGADMIKAMAGPAMAAQNGKSICITPQDSEKSDPSKQFSTGNGDCKFDRQEVNSAGLHIAGTCTKNGTSGKFTADGTLTATSQDVTVTMDAPSPAGAVTLKIHSLMQRTGDCKPGDLPMPTGGAAM